MTDSAPTSRLFNASLFTRGLYEFRPRRFDVSRLVSQLLCQLERVSKGENAPPDEVILACDTTLVPDPLLLKAPSGYSIVRTCVDLTSFIDCLNQQSQAAHRYFVVMGSAIPIALNRMSKRTAHAFQMANMMAMVPPETIEFCAAEWMHPMRQTEQNILFMEKPGRFFVSDTLRRTERQWQGGFRLDTNAIGGELRQAPQNKSGFAFGAMQLNKARNFKYVEHNVWLHSHEKNFASLCETLGVSLQNFCAAQNLTIEAFDEVWLCCPDFNLAGLLAAVLRKNQLCQKQGRFFAPSFFFGWQPMADFVMFAQNCLPQSLFIYFDGRHTIKLIMSQESSL